MLRTTGLRSGRRGSAQDDGAPLRTTGLRSGRRGSAQDDEANPSDLFPLPQPLHCARVQSLPVLHPRPRPQRPDRAFPDRATPGLRRRTRAPLGGVQWLQRLESHAPRGAMGSDRGRRARLSRRATACEYRPDRPGPFARRHGPDSRGRTLAARDGGLALRGAVRAPPSAQAGGLRLPRRGSVCS